MNTKKLALFAGAVVVVAGGLIYALGIYPPASLRGGEGAIGKRDVYRAEQPADATVTPSAAPVATQVNPQLMQMNSDQMHADQMHADQMHSDQMHSDMNSKMRSDMNSKMHSDMNSKMRSDMNSKMRSDMNSKMHSEMNSQMQSNMMQR